MNTMNQDNRNTIKTVVLSERLRTIAEMVTPGLSVADVGCDHGFVSIYLVQKKISDKVIAMDVRKGPLSAAAEHIRQYHLEDYIETRLSDGIRKLDKGEAQCMICAGMGGPLMQEILLYDFEKTTGFQELILQPQSELKEFRSFLRNHGFQIIEERILCEEGKYYFPMKVVFGKKEAGEEDSLFGAPDEELFDCYGEMLIRKKDPVLKQFLQKRQRILSDLIETLAEEQKNRTQNRLTELNEELMGIEKVLDWINN